MTDDFVIDQVSWHTQAENVESPDQVRARFTALAKFLDANSLSKRPLAGTVDESFSIRASDLTDEGLRLMRKSYDAWLRGIDRGKPRDDVRPLEKALSRLRASR